MPVNELVNAKIPVVLYVAPPSLLYSIAPLLAIPVKVKPPLPPQSITFVVVCVKPVGALGVVNVNVPVTEQAGLPWLRTNTAAPV